MWHLFVWVGLLGFFVCVILSLCCGFFSMTKCKHFLSKMNIFIFGRERFFSLLRVNTEGVNLWQNESGHQKPARNLHMVKQEKQEQTINEIVHYG